MHLRNILNNFTNAFIDKFSNEIVYGKKLNEDFNINDSDAKRQIELTDARIRNRQEAADFIAFAAANAKLQINTSYLRELIARLLYLIVR